MPRRNNDVQCTFCDRTFWRESAREQHEAAVHPNGGRIAPRNITTAHSHVAGHAPIIPAYTRTEPKEEFVVDFVSPGSEKCTLCGEKGAMPVTALCPTCDPLMAAMVNTTNNKAAADYEKERDRKAKERAKADNPGIVSQIAGYLRNGNKHPPYTTATPGTEADLGNYGDGAYAHGCD